MSLHSLHAPAAQSTARSAGGAARVLSSATPAYIFCSRACLPSVEGRASLEQRLSAPPSLRKNTFHTR